MQVLKMQVPIGTVVVAVLATPTFKTAAKVVVVVVGVGEAREGGGEGRISTPAGLPHSSQPAPSAHIKGLVGVGDNRPGGRRQSRNKNTPPLARGGMKYYE